MHDLGIFLDLDPGMRDYWIEGMPEIQRAINADENQVGAVQFCWVRRHVSRARQGNRASRDASIAEFAIPSRSINCRKRGIVGEAAWGTVDGWRRPRPEYWLSKKLYSPVQIEEKPLAMPQAGQADRRSRGELEPVRRFEPVRLPLGTRRRERRSPRASGADEQRHVGNRREAAAASPTTS